MPYNETYISKLQTWLNQGGQLSVNAMRPYVESSNLQMRQHALLRRDEWMEIDRVVLDTVKTGLVGIQDLISLGLTRRLGGLASRVAAYEVIGEMTAANVSMDADVPGQEDRLEYDTIFVPVPIIHKDFRFSLRDLEGSRRLGDPIETEHVRAATRVVREQMETMLFSGHSKQLAGYTIQGYTTATYRIQSTAAALGGGDWGTAGNAYKTVQGGITALNALGYNGPFMVYVASTQYGQALNLIDPTNARSELSVIKANIPDVIDVKRSFDLSDGVMVMVQMTSNVVDLAIAQDVTPVQWQEMGGMITKFRVMTALAPRIKIDANNHSGVLHVTAC